MDDKRHLSALLFALWRHIPRRRRAQLLGLCGLMLVGTFAEMASLGMVLPFLGALTEPGRVFVHPWAQPLIGMLRLTEASQLLLPLTVLFGLAALVSGATRVALLWAQTRLGNDIGGELGSAAYRRTLYQPYAVHALRNSSEVIAVLMTKINTIIYFIIIPFLTLVTAAVIVLSILAFLVFVDPELTIKTMLVFGSFYALVAYATKRQLARDGHRVTQGQSQMAQVVQEGLGGIRDVLIDGLQETYYRIYRQNDLRLRRALANIAILGGAPRPILESFGLVLIGWLAFSMSGRTEGMAGAIPVLGALALAAQRLLPLMQQGYAGWTAMLGGQASLRDVLELLDQPLPRHSALPRPAPLPFRHGISLHDLNFRYSPRGPWVLSGIDLKIPRGSRIGFIGTTGSGKSSLLDIVMGLLTPSSGSLRIDDTVVDESNRRAWQAHIAHVPQTIYLADASIAENIAFGVPSAEIDLARVKQAAQCAQMADSIDSWPEGYGTFVGERGIRLSGGQRQRIGIARALYKEADVLVFDEATSALDGDTELAVMSAVDALESGLTILIVAHRISTLRNCGQIVELSQGRITRVGSYEGVVARAAHDPSA